jgi:hypothetical protein
MAPTRTRFPLPRNGVAVGIAVGAGDSVGERVRLAVGVAVGVAEGSADGVSTALGVSPGSPVSRPALTPRLVSDHGEVDGPADPDGNGSEAGSRLRTTRANTTMAAIAASSPAGCQGTRTVRAVGVESSARSTRDGRPAGALVWTDW